MAKCLIINDFISIANNILQQPTSRQLNQAGIEWKANDNQVNEEKPNTIINPSNARPAVAGRPLSGINYENDYYYIVPFILLA